MAEEIQDDGFISPDEVFGKDKEKLNFKLIVMLHLKTITTLQTKEWVGGYWKNQVSRGAGGVDLVSKIYIADTREEFINAVLGLYDLLYPYFDKEIKDFDTKWTKNNPPLKETKKEDQVNMWVEKINNHRELYRELGAFLKRKQYFKGKLMVD